MDLTIYYIVKDAIKTLPHSLEHSFEIADNVVIVDTGSTDGTNWYLQGLMNENKKLVYLPFIQKDGFSFSKARNFALTQCKTEWVLALDADEQIDKCYAENLKKLIIENSNIDAFYFQVNNFIESPFWIKQPIVFYGQALRLFKNKKEYFYKGVVHEELIGPEKTLFIKNIPIYHFQYNENRDAIEKMSTYLTMLEEKVKEEGWTAKNYMHFGDCYRRKFIWRKNIDDLRMAISYFEKSLSVEKNETLFNITSNLKFVERQYVERQKQIESRKNGSPSGNNGKQGHSRSKNKNRQQRV